MRSSITRNTFLVVIFLFAFSVVKAQEENNETTRDNLYTGFYTFAGIGPAIPLGSFGDNRSSGFDLNTAVSWNYESGFMLRGNFDFSSFTFESGEITQEINGETFDVEGSNNLITFNIGPGYHFKSNKRLAPYIYSGFGFSILTNPVLEFDNTTNLVEVTNEANADFSIVGGAGVDYILNYSKRNNDRWKPFMLYFESFFTYIPADVDISPSTFALLTFNVGVKANL